MDRHYVKAINSGINLIYNPAQKEKEKKTPTAKMF
jgi:hypothetical protein